MKHINLIRKICHSFSQSSGIEYSELFSEACLCYYETKGKFKKEKGVKRSTWIYTVISNHLINFINREKKHGIRLENDIPADIREVVIEYEKEFSELSQKLAKIIFEYEDIFTFDKSPKFNRGLLVMVLREEYNWSWPLIWKAMSNIKNDLKTVTV